MGHNPYAPPQAPVEGADRNSPGGAPIARLYSTSQLTIAALLGGLVPVGILAAANLRALGRSRHSIFTIVGCLLATIGLFVFAVKFPDIPMLVTTGSVMLIVYVASNQAFAAALERHRTAGGAVASWWRVIGITMLCAVIVGVLAVVVATFLARRGIPSA